MKTTPIDLTEEEAKFLLRCIKSQRVYVELLMTDSELVDDTMSERLNTELGFAVRLRKMLSEIIQEP